MKTLDIYERVFIYICIRSEIRFDFFSSASSGLSIIPFYLPKCCKRRVSLFRLCQVFCPLLCPLPSPSSYFLSLPCWAHTHTHTQTCHTLAHTHTSPWWQMTLEAGGLLCQSHLSSLAYAILCTTAALTCSTLHINGAGRQSYSP